MKWIGQHIWDFISRFRSDVYLESVDSGTIASGGNLGLDSNNKIVKSASPAGEIDLASAEVTGVLTVDHGGTGASSLTDNAILTGTGTSPITAESTLTYDGEIYAHTSTPAGSYIGRSHSTTPTSGWATNSNSGFSTIINLDNDINTAAGETNIWQGLNISIDDDATHDGTINYVGLDTQIDFANTIDPTQRWHLNYLFENHLNPRYQTLNFQFLDCK